MRPDGPRLHRRRWTRTPMRAERRAPRATGASWQSAPELAGERGHVRVVYGAGPVEVDGGVVGKVGGYRRRRPHPRGERGQIEEIDDFRPVEVPCTGSRGRLAVRMDLPDASTVRRHAHQASVARDAHVRDPRRGKPDPV